VWGIVLNVILFQYKIINYMNVFFTCKIFIGQLVESFLLTILYSGKNSLVIILQLYRLYVVNAEFWKNRRESRMAKSRQFQSRRKVQDADQNSIYMISNERSGDVKKKIRK